MLFINKDFYGVSMSLELIFIIIFLTSLISLMILRPVGIKLNLVDFPNERKIHSGNIPLVGGLGIFITVLVSNFLIDFDYFIKVLIYASSLILIQGVCDDLMNLKAKTKILFQASVTGIVIYITDVKLTSFGYLLGGFLPFELGLFSIPITIIAVVGLTNAINMTDGIDGNAAGLILIAIIGILYFSINDKNSTFSYFLVATALAIIPFMIFNVFPLLKTKIFLGDAGSLFLGFIISWALIYSAENVTSFNPSFALWCVTIPLLDFFTVITIRTLNKRSLIIANKDHLHHNLLNKGVSNNLVTLLIIRFGLTFLLIGIVLEYTFPEFSFLVFSILFLFYLLLRFNDLPMRKDKEC
jgi:UDP-GlcNAc:undecaprenyl-phosphate GlcNAc-1-phosphate transferase